jgi:hypothetical protein
MQTTEYEKFRTATSRYFTAASASTIPRIKAVWELAPAPLAR